MNNEIEIEHRDIWSILGLAIISIVVMIPRLLTPEFGLLDDGVSIHVSRVMIQAIDQLDIKFILELENLRGRFRPFYWLFFTSQYHFFGQDPLGYFIVQWFSLGVTTVSIYGIVKQSIGDHIASLLSGLIFLLSPPVIESYFTLSKPEPIIVLLLGVSMVGLLRMSNLENGWQRKIWFMVSGLFLFLAYFTKETVLVMVFVSGAFALVGQIWNYQLFGHSRVRNALWTYFLLNVIFAGMYWSLRSLSGTAEIAVGGDSGHYNFTLGNITSSLICHQFWYIRDFSIIFPILISVLFGPLQIRKHPSMFHHWIVIFVVLWLSGWILIMLPWHSLLEYYLLPTAFGIAILAGIWLRSILSWKESVQEVQLFSWFLSLCFLGLIAITFINGRSNGLVQIAIDSSNRDLVQHLSETVPPDGVVLVNLPEPNEYVYEIGSHLSELYQRSDIQVRYFNTFDKGQDSGAFVVTPIMVNQPFPTVRIPVSEKGAEEWKSHLLDEIGEGNTSIYTKTVSVQSRFIALEKLVCPILEHFYTSDLIFCWFERPIIDTRTFAYGWENFIYSPDSE